jgi:hypothetical protein
MQKYVNKNLNVDKLVPFYNQIINLNNTFISVLQTAKEETGSVFPNLKYE